MNIETEIEEQTIIATQNGSIWFVHLCTQKRTQQQRNILIFMQMTTWKSTFSNYKQQQQSHFQKAVKTVK